MQITGTALVLDEIINHVQSLQRQVEMKQLILSIPPLWFSVPVDETSGGQPEDRLRRSRRLLNGGGNERLDLVKYDFTIVVLKKSIEA
ncbi:hypothetical protein BHM03_00036260 [Ensete ventricosum]|nr:hypothetical protein BHM03_00036260 [Ensete ventricosum]